MTRINAFIPVAELSDKHLLAEHREIKRIPNMVNSGKAKIENIPSKFTLGKGHVKFFYNKLLWLFNRYQQIRDECYKRGFNITDYSEAFMVWSENEYLVNDWQPDKTEIKRIQTILRERIAERTKT